MNCWRRQNRWRASASTARCTEGECEPIEIGLSNKFVSDALHVIDDEKILLCFNSASSPFVIAPLEGNAYRYIIAPVRLG